MDEDIAFVEKEIQRLEDITKKTYYRLASYRRLKKRLEERERTANQNGKITQLTLFGT